MFIVHCSGGSVDISEYSLFIAQVVQLTISECSLFIAPNKKEKKEHEANIIQTLWKVEAVVAV